MAANETNSTARPIWRRNTPRKIADIDAAGAEQELAQPVEIGADDEEAEHDVEGGHDEERADGVDPGRDLDGGAEGDADARREQAQRQHRRVEAADHDGRVARQARQAYFDLGEGDFAGEEALDRPDEHPATRPDAQQQEDRRHRGHRQQRERLVVDQHVDRRGPDVDGERHRHREEVALDDLARPLIEGCLGYCRHEGGTLAQASQFTRGDLVLEGIGIERVDEARLVRRLRVHQERQRRLRCCPAASRHVRR